MRGRVSAGVTPSLRSLLAAGLFVVGASLACVNVAFAQGAAPQAKAGKPPARGTAGVPGIVTRVTDGDSLWFTPESAPAPIEVRLQDIDAPELCQPWGTQARDALADRVLGQPAVLKASGRDDHGRTLGRLWVEGVDIGERLVRDGHAWSWRLKHDRGPFVAQERMARALLRGLHAEPGVVMPRDFRRNHGPCTGSAGPAPTAASTTAAASLPPAARGATPTFRCDGRTYCSQMTSCVEATFFLRNCPGTKMDGDGDGVPCEGQFCRAP